MRTVSLRRGFGDLLVERRQDVVDVRVTIGCRTRWPIKPTGPFRSTFGGSHPRESVTTS
jgi:hypothetical protein